MEMEAFSPEWRDRCRGFLQRLGGESFEDPITLELVEYYRSRRETLLFMLEHAEQYAARLALRCNELVLCHTDIHPGNLFIDHSGSLFIIHGEVLREWNRLDEAAAVITTSTVTPASASRRASVQLL